MSDLTPKERIEKAWGSLTPAQQLALANIADGFTPRPRPRLETSHRVVPKRTPSRRRGKK